MYPFRRIQIAYSRSTTIWKLIVYKYYITTTKNVSTKRNWLSGDINGHVENLPINLIKEEKSGSKKEGEYVKAKLWRNTASSTSKTYEVKLALFENEKPEELFLFICDYRKTLESTEVTSMSRLIQYLYTLLWGEYLHKLN